MEEPKKGLTQVADMTREKLLSASAAAAKAASQYSAGSTLSNDEVESGNFATIAECFSELAEYYANLATLRE